MWYHLTTRLAPEANASLLSLSVWIPTCYAYGVWYFKGRSPQVRVYSRFSLLFLRSPNRQYLVEQKTFVGVGVPSGPRRWVMNIRGGAAAATTTTTTTATGRRPVRSPYPLLQGKVESQSLHLD